MQFRSFCIASFVVVVCRDLWMFGVNSYKELLFDAPTASSIISFNTKFLIGCPPAYRDLVNTRNADCLVRLPSPLSATLLPFYTSLQTATIGFFNDTFPRQTFSLTKTKARRVPLFNFSKTAVGCSVINQDTRGVQRFGDARGLFFYFHGCAV